MDIGAPARGAGHVADDAIDLVGLGFHRRRRRRHVVARQEESNHHHEYDDGHHTERRNLVVADTDFRNDAERWVLPAPETRYEDAVAHYERALGLLPLGEERRLLKTQSRGFPPVMLARSDEVQDDHRAGAGSAARVARDRAVAPIQAAFPPIDASRMPVVV